MSNYKGFKRGFVSVVFLSGLLSNCVTRVSARKLATNRGWNLKDLLNTPTYSSLNRSYNARLESITEDGTLLLFISRKCCNGKQRCAITPYQN
jgi:hypothetical protein